jgi:hypothetical protein
MDNDRIRDPLSVSPPSEICVALAGRCPRATHPSPASFLARSRIDRTRRVFRLRTTQNFTGRAFLGVLLLDFSCCSNSNRPPWERKRSTFLLSSSDTSMPVRSLLGLKEQLENLAVICVRPPRCRSPRATNWSDAAVIRCERSPSSIGAPSERNRQLIGAFR